MAHFGGLPTGGGFRAVRINPAGGRRGGRCLTALEKKQMFPNGVPNMGPFTPNIDHCDWEDRNIANEIGKTFQGMKKTYQDDHLGLNKFIEKVPYIGDATKKVFGSGKKPRKPRLKGGAAVAANSYLTFRAKHWNDARFSKMGSAQRTKAIATLYRQS